MCVILPSVRSTVVCLVIRLFLTWIQSAGPRDDYVVGKTRYYVPYRQAGQVGRPVDVRQPYPQALSKFDRQVTSFTHRWTSEEDQITRFRIQSMMDFRRYYRRPSEPVKRVYYKDGRPLSYNPFEVYGQRATFGYNPFA